MKKLIILAFASVFTVTGCLNRDFAENELNFQTDVQEIKVPGEFATDPGADIFKFNVSSNRNWTAKLDFSEAPSGEQFAYLQQDEGYAFDRVTRTSEVGLCFDSNTTNKKRKARLDLFCEGGKRISIPVEQAGITYSLSAAAAKTTVVEEGEDVEIYVKCNTEWKAELLSGGEFAELDAEEGCLSDTLTISFDETDISESRTAEVKLSCEDCPDIRITFTQAGSSLKIFKTLRTTFQNGRSGNGLVPVLVIDKNALGSQAVNDGAKFYFTTGTGSFDAIADPKNTDTELSDNGIDFLPADYQTSTTGTAKFYQYFYKILAKANGYKDKYIKVQVRVWSFGQKYIYNQTSPVNGLSISGAAGGKSTYYIRFQESGKTTMGLSAASVLGGDARALMKYNLKFADSSFDFKANGQSVKDTTITGGPTTVPALCITPSFNISAGQSLSLNAYGSNYSYLWSYLIMEECQYKPSAAL